MAGKSRAPRVDPGVWEHPKTQLVAARCKMDPGRVVYHLTKMWHLVLNSRSDGLLVRMTRDPSKNQPAVDQFGDAVNCDRPGRLLNALIEARFLDRRGTELHVHDWHDWQAIPRVRAHARQDSHSLSSYSGTGNPGSLFLSGTVGTSGSTELPLQQTGESGVVGVGGSRGKGRKTTGEGPTSSAPFTRFMWWLVEGFGFRGYVDDGYDAAQITRFGQGKDMAVVAECYIAIERGDFGDDFDRRNLTARHALRKINPFLAFKRRRQINGTIIPLTAAGIEHHPSAARCGPDVAGADAGAPAGRNGAADPTPRRADAPDLGSNSKLRALRAERAANEQGFAF
jgi:hypothetical protein